MGIESVSVQSVPGPSSGLERKVRERTAIVCVVGLGYVGKPLAVDFSHSLNVIGFDISERRLAYLEGVDHGNVELSHNPSRIGEADIIIVCVPTPVTKSKEPDLGPVVSAAQVVGANMKRGAIVVLESTVYPGVTEEVMVPILEERSGMKCGADFKVGYSPERINPGDQEHTLGRIQKIVSGMDKETTDTLAELYAIVTTPYRVNDIRTAEAAKVIENIQRDLNIALMNELALIFNKMGLNTKEVLDAAATKWNFHRYSPGMVGGHCIPVDPYYLVYKARTLGYHPQVILAGRSINDYMPRYAAKLAIRGLNDAGKVIRDCNILVMGLTYKENVPDVRESPAEAMVEALKEYSKNIYGHDPLLTEAELRSFGVEPYSGQGRKVDCIIVAAAHDEYRRGGLPRLKEQCCDHPVLVDIRGAFDREEAERLGFLYRTL